VARMEDTRLPKRVMFGELVGGAVSAGGQKTRDTQTLLSINKCDDDYVVRRKSNTTPTDFIHSFYYGMLVDRNWKDGIKY